LKVPLVRGADPINFSNRTIAPDIWIPADAENSLPTCAGLKKARTGSDRVLPADPSPRKP
jgi:hypothetical protein